MVERAGSVEGESPEDSRSLPAPPAVHTEARIRLSERIDGRRGEECVRLVWPVIPIRALPAAALRPTSRSWD